MSVILSLYHLHVHTHTHTLIASWSSSSGQEICSLSVQVSCNLLCLWHQSYLPQSKLVRTHIQLRSDFHWLHTSTYVTIVTHRLQVTNNWSFMICAIAITHCPTAQSHSLYSVCIFPQKSMEQNAECRFCLECRLYWVQIPAGPRIFFLWGFPIPHCAL